jgi:aspartyl-tRNA(Asn)/glutamyl-tRNA(Gln) amidotransferase subunit A
MAMVPATTTPFHLTVAEAARLLAARKLSPVELTDAVLERIEATEPQLHAYITVLADKARDAARRAETEIMAGRYRGPLHGIPFAVKDNYHVAGVPTTGGSRLLDGFVADRTATVIARLQEAGAVLLGKLNTWEYGTGNGEAREDLPYPLARNPYDTARFSGGSSTGAGVAVAAGSALFALGTDTGGSVRLPAAATGVQGMKATFGRVSRAGILPNCWSSDVPGPLSWTAEDNAMVLQAMAGFDPADVQSSDRPTADLLRGLDRGAAGLRIGVLRALGDDGEPVQPEIMENMDDAVALLAAQGAAVETVTLPVPVGAYRQVLSIINWSESFSIHEEDFMQRHHLMGEALRGKMMAGFMVRAVDYIAAQRQRRSLAKSTDAMLAGFDAIITPTTRITAPPFADQQAVVRFTANSVCSPFSISGHPAMAVPTGFDAAGLPTSAQIVGHYFDEATIYRVARALEHAMPARARPAL